MRRKKCELFRICFSFTLLPIILLLSVPGAQSEVSESEDPRKTIFVTVNETLKINLDRYFTGYNLTYDMEPQVPWASINSKVENISSTYFSSSITWSSISMNHEATGYWGQEIAGVDRDLVVHFGKRNDPFSIPNFYKTIEFAPDIQTGSVTCYDILPLTSTAYVIDCILIDTTSGDINLKGNGTEAVANFPKKYENIFYYLTSDDEHGEVVNRTNQVARNCTIPFIRQTVKLLLKNEVYILRYIKSSTLREDCRTSNFLEIFRYDDTVTGELVHIETLTNDTFRLPCLSIEKVAVYSNEIFIVDDLNGLIRFGFSPHKTKQGNNDSRIAFHIYNPGDLFSFNTISLLPLEKYQTSQLIMVLGSDGQFIHEVDWSKKEKPVLMNIYELDTKSKEIEFLDLSTEYIIVRLKYSGSGKRALQIYKRESKLLTNLFFLFNERERENSLWYLNREAHTLIYFFPNGITNYQIFPNALVLSPQANDGGKSILKLSSLERGVVKDQVNLSISILPFDDKFIHKRTDAIQKILNIVPGSDSTHLYTNFVGPNIAFSSENKSSNVMTHKVRLLNPRHSFASLVDFQTSLKDQNENYFTNLNFLSSGKFHYAFQLQHVLYRFICTFSSDFDIINDEQAMSCVQHSSINLEGRATQMFLTKGLIILKTSNKPLEIDFFDYNSGKRVKNISFVDPLDECNDLDLLNSSQGHVLYCTQQGRRQILGYNPADSKFHPVITINHKTLKIDSMKFNPIELEISPTFPNYLLIRDNNKIHIVKVTFHSHTSPAVADLVGQITSDVFLSNPSQVRISLAIDALLLCSQELQILEEYDIQDTTNIYLRKRISLQGYNFTIPGSSESLTSSSSFTSAKYSQFFYLHGFKKEAEKKTSVVIIIRTGQQASNSLFHIVPFTTEYSSLALSVAADVNHVDYLAYVGKYEIGFMRIYHEPYISYKFSMPSHKDALYENRSLVIKAVVPPELNITEEIYDLVLWNSFSTPMQTDQHFPRLDLDPPNENHSYYFNDHDYFLGAVQTYLLRDCVHDECGTLITMQQKMHFNHYGVQIPGKFILDLHYGYGFLFTQLEKELLAIDPKDSSTIVYSIDLLEPDDDDFTCNRVVSDNFDNITISICQNVNENRGQFIISKSTTTDHLIISRFYTTLELLIDAQLYERLLIVLEEFGSVGGGETRKGRLRLFEIAPHDRTFLIEEVTILTEISFGCESFWPTSFDLGKIHRVLDPNMSSGVGLPNKQKSAGLNISGDYLMVISDANRGLKVILFRFGDKEKGESFIEPNDEVFDINLADYMNAEFATRTKIRYQGVKLVDQLRYDKTNIVGKLIVVTESFHSYLFNFSLSFTKHVSSLTTLKVFLHFDGYKYTNRFKVTNFGLIILASQNSNSDDQLLYYEIPKEIGTGNDTMDHYQTIRASLPIATHKGPTYEPIAFEVGKVVVENGETSTEVIKLWKAEWDSQGNKVVEEYQMNQYSGIIIRNNSVKTKIAHVLAFNQLRSAEKSVWFLAASEKSFIPVILLVLGAMVLIALTIYGMMKRTDHQEIETEDDKEILPRKALMDMSLQPR